MANTQSMCSSFLGEVLSGVHNFASNNPARSANTADTFKAALYLASATLNASTTAYSVTGEVSGTGYTAGGVAVTNGTNPASTNSSATAGTGYWTPSASIVYTGVTLPTSFDTMLLYNSSQSDKAVAVYTFGSQTITAGNFTLTMPANAASTALLRLATT
jgi:hypothetical protein